MIVCAVDWQARIWPGLFWSVCRWAWWKGYASTDDVARAATAFHCVRDQYEMRQLCGVVRDAAERGDDFTGRDAFRRVVAWSDGELAKRALFAEDPREASGAWLRAWDEKKRDRRRGERVVWSWGGAVRRGGAVDGDLESA